MRMAWALRRDQPSIRIDGLNCSLHSVQPGVFCRYFLMQFSRGLKGARRDIERIELNGASCQERTELINAYIGRHS